MQTAKDEVLNLLLQAEETLRKNARIDGKTLAEWQGDEDGEAAFNEVLEKLELLGEAVGYYID
jgi:hypothetical protein